jgi:N-methylhydantoinase A
VRRGYDPRDFVLVAYGGGGAMHASAVAAELHMSTVVVPPSPGHFSAWGMLVAEPRLDVRRTRVLRTDRIEEAEVEAVFLELEREAGDRFAREGAVPDELALARSLDMRYAGQEHTVRVPVRESTLIRLEQDFHTAHRRSYTFALDETPVELVTFHVTARRPTPAPRLRELPMDGRSAERAVKGRRAVDFDVDGLHDTSIYERSLLPPGFAAEGPLIVEEEASTTLVHPGQALEVDAWGNLLVRLPAPQGGGEAGRER